ncbi:pheromone-regulated protein prm10 [Umbelopsis nana]
MKKRESLRHASSWPDLPHVTFDDVPLQIPEYSAIYEDEKQNDGYSHDIVDMTSTYPPQTESPSTLIEDTAGEHQPDYNKGSPDADLVSVALGQAKLDGYSDEYAKHIAESARIVNNMWVNKRTRFASNVTTNGSVLSALIHMEGSQKRGKPRRRHGGNKKKRRSGVMTTLGDNLSAVSNVIPDKVKRPSLAKHHRHSWMSGQLHTVPSLRKTFASSKRGSIDSVTTTASQFEPISLDDRIRLTFEIANILQKQSLIRQLARCLMRYGCPSHRLESVIRQVSNTLRIEGDYVYIPNIMLMSFIDSSTHTTETYFVREIQGFDMGRLEEIYRLEKLISHGEVTVESALEYLDTVMNKPDFYPKWAMLLSYAAGGFASAVLFFGGSWKDGGLAAGLSFALSIYEIFANYVAALGPLFEITIAIFIGFIAKAGTHGGFCFVPSSFGSIVMLLPGWTMTSAIIEVASRSWISGIIRMVYAILYAFLLGYGLSLGENVYVTVDPSVSIKNPEVCPNMPSKWFNFLLVPVFSITYCVYLRAMPRRYLLMSTVACAGYATSFALSNFVNTSQQVIQLVPAFVVGVLGNGWTKWRKQMSFDAILLGAFFLVPGSLGLRSGLAVFSEPDSGQGLSLAINMIQAAMGITVGLFLSTLCFYPRGTQHTPLMSF